LPLLSPAIITDGAEAFFAHVASLEQRPKLGAVTNSDRRIVDALKELDVVPRHINEEDIITSFEVGFQKPDPRMLEVALARICGGTVKAAECFFIGDDYVTYASARLFCASDVRKGTTKQRQRQACERVSLSAS
jgi:FMN phosphatase YigB (HAD superfamily)